MAKRPDMLMFAATLALVLLSVPSSYGQTAACTNKISECASKVASIDPDNTAALAEFCSSVFPTLTECINQAKSICTESNDMLSGLETNLDTFGALCGGGGQCMMSAAQCMASVQSSVPDFSSLDMSNIDPSVLQQVCPALQQVKTCFDGLDAQCRNSNLTLQFSQVINQISGFCAAVTADGQCPGAFSCFASVASTSMSCSTLTTVLSCIKSKVQEGSCNVDQSGLSYSDLETMVNELCTAMQPFPNADHNCSALNQCVMEGYGVTTFDVTVLLSLTQRLISPKGLCRYVEIGTGCYGSQASACGYSQPLVTAMTAEHTKFNDRCPKSEGEQCPGAFSCIAAVADANMNCSTLRTVLNCVKGKVQEGSCSVNQSSLSYSDLETMVNELCTAVTPLPNVNYGCSALSRCILRGYGITQTPLDGVTLADFAAKLVTPKGMCKYIKIGSGCFDSEKTACGYNQMVVSAMTAQQTKFNNRCPESDGDGDKDTGDNGSTGQFVPTMLLSLAVIIALLFI